jgi:hypothetical protein
LADFKGDMVSNFEIKDPSEVGEFLIERKNRLVANGCEENYPRVVKLDENIVYIEK